MKLIIVSIISFTLGVAATLYYAGSEIKASNQLSNQFALMTELRYLEILEEGKHEELKDYLKMAVDCQSSTVRQFIENDIWNKNPLSDELLEQSKKYHDSNNNCHNDIKRSLESE